MFSLLRSAASIVWQFRLRVQSFSRVFHQKDLQSRASEKKERKKKRKRRKKKRKKKKTTMHPDVIYDLSSNMHSWVFIECRFRFKHEKLKNAGRLRAKSKKCHVCRESEKKDQSEKETSCDGRHFPRKLENGFWTSKDFRRMF